MSDAGRHLGETSLSVERTDRTGCVLLVIRGAVDSATEGQLLAAVWAVQRERVGRPIVLDLSGLEFTGSIGLSELVMIRHNATNYREDVRIVAGRNQRLRQLLDVLGPRHIHNSVDDACTT